MEQAVRHGVSWTAVVLPKVEEEVGESASDLRSRPCTARDVAAVFAYLSSQKKRRPSLEEKVRLGYLLHTSSGEENARDFAEAKHFRAVARSQQI